MDNPNNPNSPNNPTPTPPTPQDMYPPPSGSDQSAWQPAPVDQTLPTSNVDQGSTQPPVDPLNQQTANFPPSPPPMPEANPFVPSAPQSTFPPEPTPAIDYPDLNQQPLTPQMEPTPSSQPPDQLLPAPPPPMGGNEPQQTWPNQLTNLEQPADQAFNQTGGTSPLDNPWGSPAQTPSIDEGGEPPLNPPPLSSEMPQGEMPAAPQPDQSEMGPNILSSESAPTDLSHLIGNNPLPLETSANPQANVTVPENLIVPPGSSTPDVPNIPSEEHKGIPMWIIGVGIGLLLVVAGASAYFILGIGQTPSEESTTSVPATTAPRPTVAPTVAPTSTPRPEATGSGSFGELSTSGGTPQATSAADLIRQRQQQGQ
ncbi:MAG: hypothetical protein Q8P92_01505 [Candidatus Daviesbacteria bacterium]|nr:hypothetical protein [Candidatus Daviesbacteria bacterium]